MNTLPILKFLKTLLATYTSFEWHGWQKGAEQEFYARATCKGSFVAFEAYMLGFVVTIKEHDYRHCFEENVGVRGHHDVFRRRPDIDSETDVTWIEIEVRDVAQRFGRASLFPLLTIPERHERYRSAKQLFDGIKAIGVLHRVDLDRLSAPHAMTGFCRVLNECRA